MTPRTRVGLGAAAAVVGAAWLALPDGSAPAPTHRPGITPGAVENGPTAPPRTAPAPLALRAGDRDLWAEVGETQAPFEDPLSAYLRSSVYPPDSRPLVIHQDDLIHPNQRHEDWRPLDGSSTFLFSADKYYVVGTETLEAFIDVRRRGERIPVAVVDARATRIEPTSDGVPPSAPVAFDDAEGLAVTSLAPASLPFVDAEAVIQLDVAFRADSERVVRASFRFHYTPAASVPARFTGVFRDDVVDGSLVVHAGVAVGAPGFYIVECNLYDSTGAPVAWTIFRGDLTAGDHRVPLSFFGKVLHDRAAEPPFHIGQLRGRRILEGRDPDAQLMPSFDGDYQTRAYRLDDFSDAAWDSEHKRSKIDLLTRIAGDPRFPQPSPPPE